MEKRRGVEFSRFFSFNDVKLMCEFTLRVSSLVHWDANLC